MTSWDVSCDMMAMLNGKMGGAAAAEGPSHADAIGTKYKWEDCQFINLACPWARDTGTEGGDIASGVAVPMYYPTALTYKFGVTANAEQTVTLNGGTYYMAEKFPIEEVVKPEAAATSVETKEKATVYRIGGHGSTIYKRILGVLVNGVIQQEGVDYVEEGGAIPGEEGKIVKMKFAKAFVGTEIVKFMYFSEKAHALPQAVHASTTVTPAAVRGRNIEVIIGEGGEAVRLRGTQSFDLSASHTGQIQREMGFYDPIGYNETGIDCSGSIGLDPKEEGALYTALEQLTGIARAEVFGYLNEFPVPLSVKIFNPRAPAEVIKSIHVGDALLQIPGSAVKVGQVLNLPLAWESEEGTFEEVKGE
jgi:hypothetical protein